MEEIEGLLKIGTFKSVVDDDIIDGRRIFGSRFMETVNNVNSGVIHKSKLVAQRMPQQLQPRLRQGKTLVRDFYCPFQLLLRT